MSHRDNRRRSFYVVQFIELPFKGIKNYVCVPYTWLVVRRATDHKAAVAYPKDEDPSVTRDRVKRKERYDDEWRFYMATVKYESDTYEDAEYWISKRNDPVPLVEKKSTTPVPDAPPRFSLNKKLRSANQINSSKSNDNLRNSLPRMSTERPALSEQKKHLDEKQLELDEAAQSSSAVVNDANAEPGCSKWGQSILIQDNESMECAQTEETAAASNGDESTETMTQTQRTEQNKQALSLPVINVDELTEVINVVERDHSRDVKKPDENNSITQRHLSSNTTAASITAAEPSTLAEQSSQLNQHNNQEQILESGSSSSNFQPRMENVRSIATDNYDHELHVNDVSNNESSASHGIPDSLKMSAHLYSHMAGARRLVPIQEPVEKRVRLMNITRNLTLVAQRPLNLMGQTGSSSTHSVPEQSSVITPSRSQDSPRVPKMNTKNRREQTFPMRSILLSSQDIQRVPKTNVGRSQDVAAVDPRNVLQSDANVTSALQALSSLSHKRRSFDRRLDGHQRLLTQEQYSTHALQNRYLTINKNSCKQDLQRGFPESNIYDHQSSSRSRTTEIPSMKQISAHPSNPMYQTSELPQQRQPQSNQQDSQQQPQRPRIRVSISVTPKTNRKTPTIQGVTKKTPPIYRSKVINSTQQALSTTYNNYLLNEQQLQAKLSAESTEYNQTNLSTGPQNIAASATRDNHNSEMPTCSFQQLSRIQHTPAHRDMNRNLRTQREVVNQYTETNSTEKRVHFVDNVARSTVNVNYRNAMDNACQTDEYMMEEGEKPPSPYHVVASDSDAVTDHEVISDHEMSTDDAPASGRSSADRPSTTLNSTSLNDLTHPKAVAEQEMLDNFAAVFNQMGSTLRYTCDMYHNLRSSIVETAETYKNLLRSVEIFNLVENSTSNAFPSSNVTSGVPQATEERHVEVTARANSNYENQHSNNVADEAPAENHNSSWRIFLPPEYDSQNTRWTLKYQKILPGLVELIPQSGIYVSYGELKYCQQVSKDCKSLARRLLPEVFSRTALSVCLSMSEKAQVSNNVGSNVRPELDEHASNVLLNFVSDYGRQCGWKTDLQPILNTLHNKIQEIRSKCGVMVQC